MSKLLSKELINSLNKELMDEEKIVQVNSHYDVREQENIFTALTNKGRVFVNRAGSIGPYTNWTLLTPPTDLPIIN